MTANGSAARRRAGQPMKSPLAAHSRGTTHGRVPELAGSAAQGISRAEMGPRAVTLADYADYLRTTNTRKGRPYEEKTVENYFFAGKALGTWMTGQGIDGDFTVCDTAMLNRFFRDYFAERGQGGTHSQQRNLRHLFSYLRREFDNPHPYTDDLHRYQERRDGDPPHCPGTSSRTCSRSPAEGRRY